MRSTASSGTEEFRSQFAAQLDHVEKLLLEQVTPTSAAGGLYSMIQYHLGFASESLEPLEVPISNKSRGKRMRALLSQAICSSLSVPEEVLNPLLVAAEMMHAASLVHDDIQDKDPMRWNRATVWKLFGVDHGINVGDAMTAVTYRVLTQGLPPQVKAEQVLEITRIFAETHLSMTEGQYMDLAFAARKDVTQADYFRMIALKTASACSCVCRAAAVLGSAPPELVTAYADFGHNLGMLYQVCDDIAAVWGAASRTGKKTFQDLLLKKASLPIVEAYSRNDWEFCAAMELASHHAEGGLPSTLTSTLRAMLERMEVHDACLSHADHFERASLLSLDEVHAGPGTDTLMMILKLCRQMATAVVPSAIRAQGVANDSIGSV